MTTAMHWLANHTRDRPAPPTIPHDVVSAIVDGATPVLAWREYLGLTQADVAAKLDITLAVYDLLEAVPEHAEAVQKKIAAALGITVEQLYF